MRLRGWLAGGLAVLAAGWAGAAPFTSHLAGLQAALEARRTDLLDDADAVSVSRRLACERALRVLLGASTSASRDLAFAGRVARLLERSFEAGDPLLDDVSGGLDGLESEIDSERALLALEISLLSGAKAAAASRGLAVADLRLVDAEFAATRAERARFLGRALRKILATRRALRAGGTPGPQGPRNPSFEDLDPFATFSTPGVVAIRYPSNSFFGLVDWWRSTGGARGEIGGATLPPDGLVEMKLLISSSLLQATIYQEGVNLSRSRRLQFEYRLSGQIRPCNSDPIYGLVQARAKVQVLFSPDGPGGTVTLWTGSFEPPVESGTGAINVAGSAAVDLPFLPGTGTLTFHVTPDHSHCPPPPSPNPGQPTPAFDPGNYTFFLDDLRVE